MNLSHVESGSTLTNKSELSNNNKRETNKKDFEFLQKLLLYERQNFHQIKHECLRNGTLFEDEMFPAQNESYYLKNSSMNGSIKQRKLDKIRWLRPHQIVSDPKVNQPCFIQTHSTLFVRRKNPNDWLVPCGSSHLDDHLAIHDQTFKQHNFIKGHASHNFISSLSILFQYQNSFMKIIPNDQSFHNSHYAGIFHFHIWQYGKWYDVVVDDRLPTFNGKLIQVHTFHNVEFWPALLEKAFAKLHGCYQSLHGCSLSEFLVDMTGGICETISASVNTDLFKSDQSNDGLFKILTKSVELKSHIIARISNQSQQEEQETSVSSTRMSSISQCSMVKQNCGLKRQLNNGLCKIQTYVVLETKKFDIFDEKTKNNHTVCLIKICNPWKRLNQLLQPNAVSKCDCNDRTQRNASNSGIFFDGNWIGKWSETSREWIKLPDPLKSKYNLIIDNDHDFWMPMESFVENFTEIDILHLATSQCLKLTSSTSSESFEQQTKNSIHQQQQQQQNVWHSLTLQGSWMSGVSAGGCYNHDSFHTNPIYLLPIVNQVEEESKTVSSSSTNIDNNDNEIVRSAKPPSNILIGLMQKHRESKHSTGVYDLKIGFHLFKIKPEDWRFINEIVFDDDIDLSFSCQEDQIKCHQMCVLVKMNPDFFNIHKGEHAIKFFTNVREMTARYKLSDGYYLVVPSTYAANKDGNFLLRFFSEAPFKFYAKELSALIHCESIKKHVDQTYFINRIFNRCIEKIGGLDEEVSTENLELLLSSVVNAKRNRFSFDQCHSLMALYDLEYKGTLSYGQLLQLCLDIDECYRVFLKQNQNSETRTMAAIELKSSLEEVGVYAAQRIVKMLMNRFGKLVKQSVTTTTDTKLSDSSTTTSHQQQQSIMVREMDFPSFAVCLLKVRKAIIYWNSKFHFSFQQQHQQTPSSNDNVLDKSSSMGNLAMKKSHQVHSQQQQHQQQSSTNFGLVDFIKQIIYS